MTPNDTLMEQCRREAEERYPAPPYVPLPDGLDEIFGPDVRYIKQFAYAEALYAERSKPRTSLSVDEVMEVMKPWITKNALNGDMLWEMLPEERLEGVTKYEADLRARLTAKINERTP